MPGCNSLAFAGFRSNRNSMSILMKTQRRTQPDSCRRQSPEHICEDTASATWCPGSSGSSSRVVAVVGSSLGSSSSRSIQEQCKHGISIRSSVMMVMITGSSDVVCACDL